MLAADTVVWTAQGGQVLAAGEVAVDAEGRPVLTSPGNWVLVRRGGQERAALGPDIVRWAERARRAIAWNEVLTVQPAPGG